MIKERDNKETGRIAVLLFNLGGPDGPDAVQPFLFNLFFDPAIISLPLPLRWAIAKLISTRRAPFARENYALMGGGSQPVPSPAAAPQTHVTPRQETLPRRRRSRDGQGGR